MPRAGDQFPIEDTLYKWAGTKRGALVGRVEGTGTFQVVGDTTARVLFFAQATLPGGTVVVHGYGTINFRGPSKFTFPVTGGTGLYVERPRLGAGARHRRRRGQQLQRRLPPHSLTPAQDGAMISAVRRH